MKLNILAMKDVRIGAFGQPHFTDKDIHVEAKELARGLAISEQEVRNKYVGKHLYCLGQFDDETGVITACEPVFLLACDEVESKNETTHE